MAKLRSRKIAEIIKTELSIAVDQKLRDPRKKMITITEVRLNHDMSLASVYFTTMGTDEEKQTALDVLNNAKSFLRSHVSQVLEIRKVPELKFAIDNSYEYGSKIESLLDKIKKEKNITEE